jgi:hypothetical protein
MLRTKSNQWSYEKEWRCIAETNTQLQQVPRESINSVILGCQMSKEHRREVEQALVQGSATNVRQAKKSPRTFSLTLHHR